MDRIPAEVWFEVFAYLDSWHFTALHKTSPFFRRFSQPFLHSHEHFRFYPYAGINAHLTREFLLPNEPESRRIGRDLRLWTSDDVAPLVKECTVSPDLSQAWWKGYTSCYGGDVLLYTFFELLPRFTNIRKISFFSLLFNQLFVDALVSLPNLKEIGWWKCSVHQDVTAGSTLKVERLIFLAAGLVYSREKVVLYQGEIDGAQRWLSIVDNQLLTHVSLLSEHAIRALLGADSPVFPNVATLAVELDWLPRNIVALRRFPAVRNLRILTKLKTLPHRTGSCFPLLDMYHGPPEFLTLLDSRTALRRLHIDPCSPARVQHILQSCTHTLRSVTVLVLSFDSLPTTAFPRIVVSFTALVDFRMQILLEPPSHSSFSPWQMYNSDRFSRSAPQMYTPKVHSLFFPT